MNRKVRWGVLGAANIAVEKVIPAMQRGEWCEIAAIASRDANKAEQAAARPRHSKSLWLVRGSAGRSGSRGDLQSAAQSSACALVHTRGRGRQARTLRETVALDAHQARKLFEAQARTGVKIGEAFMVRTHPQWLRARELVRAGRIGELRSIMGFFSYFNRDAANIRNVHDWGGGGLMDIGCYPINTSRFIFGEEPRRVMALLERDPEMQIDRLTSGMLDFPSGQSVFTCSTQLVPYQRMQLFGTSRPHRD